jgi:hypothetical protein
MGEHGRRSLSAED